MEKLKTLTQVRKDYIIEACKNYHWHVTIICEALKLSKACLYRDLKKWGIDPNKERQKIPLGVRQAFMEQYNSQNKRPKYIIVEGRLNGEIFIPKNTKELKMLIEIQFPNTQCEIYEEHLNCRVNGKYKIKVKN